MKSLHVSAYNGHLQGGALHLLFILLTASLKVAEIRSKSAI